MCLVKVVVLLRRVAHMVLMRRQDGVAAAGRSASHIVIRHVSNMFTAADILVHCLAHLSLSTQRILNRPL